MPTTAVDFATSCSTEKNRYGQLHADLTHCVPQFDAVTSVDRQSAGT